METRARPSGLYNPRGITLKARVCEIKSKKDKKGKLQFQSLNIKPKSNVFTMFLQIFLIKEDMQKIRHKTAFLRIDLHVPDFCQNSVFCWTSGPTRRSRSISTKPSKTHVHILICDNVRIVSWSFTQPQLSGVPPNSIGVHQWCGGLEAWHND